ncbi:MAG: response regulator [Anaerolineales bacterium]
MSKQKVATQTEFERESAKDEGFFRGYFEFSPLPGAVIGLNGDCLLVNQAFKIHFEDLQDDKPCAPKQIMDYFENQQKANELLEEIAEKKVVRRREVRMLNGHGRRLNILLSGRSLQYDQQPAVELLLMDITHQKRIERKLRHEKLRRNSFIESLIVGVFMVNPDGNLSTTNLQLSNLLGFEEGSMLGKPYQELFGLILEHALEAEVVQQALSGAVITVTEKPVIDIKTNGDTPRYFELSFFPIWDEEGNTLGWGGVLQDVTDERERTLWKLELLSILAHDIRSPLATLKGQVTALLANFQLWGEDMVEDFLEGINRSTDKLIHQIDRSLALTRVETGRLGLRPESCTATSIIQNTLDRVEGILTEHNVEVDVPDDLPNLRADPARVEELLINLLENAVRYAPPDSPILIQVRPSGNMMQFSVRDHGPGVPAEKRKQIFEKYVGEGSEGKSSGLGLYICRSIVEGHGGKMWVETPPVEDGTGARFVFTIPIMPDIEVSPKTQDKKPLMKLEADAGMNVLIVEDEPDFQVLLRTILDEAGFQVEVAPDGKTALDVVQVSPPDLILLDWVLPGMDGLNVCRNIRRWTRAPIIMVTSKTSQEDLIRALDAGADDYVTKPFRTPELLARIHSVARRRENWAEEEPDRFSEGGLTVDYETKEAWVRGEKLELTPTELDLLIYMTRNRGQVLTYDLLLAHLYGTEKDASPHNLFVHVSRLRKKIEPDPDNPQFIVTRWGLGYVFMPN